jgi:hypothetical protein
MMTAVQIAADEQLPAIDGALSPLVMSPTESLVSCCAVEVAARLARHAFEDTNYEVGRYMLRAIFRNGTRVGAFTVPEAGASMIKSAGPLSVAELVRVRMLD